jgi:hypothetical protein
LPGCPSWRSKASNLLLQALNGVERSFQLAHPTVECGLLGLETGSASLDMPRFDC